MPPPGSCPSSLWVNSTFANTAEIDVPLLPLDEWKEPQPNAKKSTHRLIAEIKAANQDFEWYPTTDEIIAAVVKDYKRLNVSDWRLFREIDSVLDIGAGNGKVLRALREQTEIHSFYAIEKSPILCQQLDAAFFIVGTDIFEQSLVSKNVGMIFCNPPYSEFVDWSAKVIRESAAPLVYLVLPERWQAELPITDAIQKRAAKTKIVGKFSFIAAEDRQARANVHLIRVRLDDSKDDAFDRFFFERFGDLKAKFEDNKTTSAAGDDEQKDGPRINPRFRSLVVGPTYLDRLVACYNEEMDHIWKNYALVEKLDIDLLREFEICPVRILKCLKARLSGLRNTYWNELFSNLRQVTDRLTAKKRQLMLDTLQRHCFVDFTVSNIHAIVVWVLKNANQYFDTQLIETFESMVEKANVKNYRSNERPYVYDRWRYAEEKPTHIALEYRIVVDRTGGLNAGSSWNRGLTETAGDFLNDLLTIASNLGFACNTGDDRLRRGGRAEWKSGELHVFEFRIEGLPSILLEVRAFLNGNLHLRMNQKFALALNVEYGRLKGWLKSGAEAADELCDENAAHFFGKHLQLGLGNLPLLGYPSAEPVRA
jgi:Domain of unknown function (DUF4942)